MSSKRGKTLFLKEETKIKKSNDKMIGRKMVMEALKKVR